MDGVLDQLRGKRLKITPQRVAILKALLGSDSHPRVGDLYNQVRKEHPMISLATVYKTLELFRDNGLVSELGFADGSARYDPNIHPHVNLICIKCGRIEDLDDRLLEKIMNGIRKKSAFKILGHRFEYYGYCDNCR